MDSRTRKRMLATRDFMAMAHRTADFRDWLPHTETPVVVALADDTVGDVLERVRRYQDAGTSDVWVVMRSSAKKFHRCAVSPTAAEDLRAAQDFPVSTQSEWGMLMDYVEHQDGKVSMHLAPGVVVEMAGASN